jgi:hypothetical protein
MNKAQEVISKIKLKDYEKQWLVSFVLYGLTILLVRSISLSELPNPFQALIVVALFLWTAVNFIGVAALLWKGAAEFYKKRNRTSFLKKVCDWLNTSDRD